jgi:tripartite-type tricarboxylate transporter receptor subunit TctC
LLTFPAEKTQLFCDFPNIPPGPFQPRGGALALTDLLAGQAQVMFDTLLESIEHIRAGKLGASARANFSPFD